MPQYYREPPYINATENFEYSEGWPGTISDINYPDSFSFSSPTATGAENFESGW
jgi:hypothetical protein